MVAKETLIFQNNSIKQKYQHDLLEKVNNLAENKEGPINLE